MRIVLDTNVLISAISHTSDYYWIYESIFDGKLTLCVSTDILTEYAEILERFYGYVVAEATLTALSYSPFVERFSPSYFWNMITQDADDNKFVDCAISASADCIITLDKHFNVLQNIPFPKVLVLKPNELLIKLEEEK